MAGLDVTEFDVCVFEAQVKGLLWKDEYGYFKH